MAVTVKRTGDALRHDGQFHLRIRRLRRIDGLSQREAAAIAGVSERTYYRWEQGLSVPHEGEHLRLLADYYRVHSLWLLTGDEGEREI